MFSLHPTLAADTIEIGELSLCKVLLINDQQYPWLILVPKRPDISEIFELNAEDQQQLWTETTAVAKALSVYSKADKMNIATLGNMVPQLHMHIIARHKSDAAWPAPVWGKVPAKPYSAEQAHAQKAAFSALLFTV
ncbi:HIT family protein [Paenalcaligenes niemegkensis]|uniref:HIT domain-containing protein n=1 Tax=Paenalcaligenes niemegkensis TaxID=2895469 RepID=UPI001EE8591F|nr:HIT family protein [Paenalcaligenes niemegkensis]MCQ9616092.1 HIT family protein [Paenalcaligenes niemegkensis]